MCECYYSQCRYHVCHTDADEGPFCEESECRATPQQLVEYADLRAKYLRQAGLPQNPGYDG
jgi:hypothetical protein